MVTKQEIGSAARHTYVKYLYRLTGQAGGAGRTTAAGGSAEEGRLVAIAAAVPAGDAAHTTAHSPASSRSAAG